MRNTLASGMVAGAVGVIALMGCTGVPLPGPGDGNGGGGGDGGGSTPAEFTAARVTRGGALYDKWWAVAGLDAPTEDHPLWADRPDPASNTRSGADTWRCKECHGWDYKGVDGAYASGSHRTGIAGIFGTTRSPQEVFDLIKDDHAYGSTGLTDADIWDFAKFVLEGQIDTDVIIDGDSFIGTVSTTNPPALTGQPIYDTSCGVCHGSDGLSIPPGGDDDFDEFVGLLSNENPFEFQHKVRFGQPGTSMPQQAGILTIEEIGELGAFAQSLPAGPGQ